MIAVAATCGKSVLKSSQGRIESGAAFDRGACFVGLSVGCSDAKPLFLFRGFPTSLVVTLPDAAATAQALAEHTMHMYTSPRGVLDPRKVFMQRWDVLIAVLLLFTAVVTPYEVAFIENNSFVDPLFIINRCAIVSHTHASASSALSSVWCTSPQPLLTPLTCH